MDMQRFGQAYTPLPEKVMPQNAARRELVDAPRKWMRFFDETMDNYLQDEPRPDEDTFYDTLIDYYAWNRNSLHQTVDQLEKLEDPTSPHNAVATELTFHRINGPMTPLWDHVLHYKGEPFDTDYLKTIQLSLAVRNTSLMRQLVQLQSSEETRETQPHKNAKGIMSEVDMAITGLEMMKQHPTIALLPAPARYGNNREIINRNIDFLMLDVEAKQARGIQVKTDTIDGAGQGRKYDDEFVTVVDGAHEFGNSTQFKHNKQGVMSLPGQIAMSVLAEQNIKETPKYVQRDEYLRSRQIAREIMKGRRNYLGEAALHLSHRLLHDLNKNS